jgi:hypothetical protein
MSNIKYTTTMSNEKSGALRGEIPGKKKRPPVWAAQAVEEPRDFWLIDWSLDVSWGF